MAPKKNKPSWMTRQRALVKQTQQNKQRASRQLPPKGGTGGNSRQAVSQRRERLQGLKANQQRIVAEGTRQMLERRARLDAKESKANTTAGPSGTTRTAYGREQALPVKRGPNGTALRSQQRGGPLSIKEGGSQVADNRVQKASVRVVDNQRALPPKGGTSGKSRPPRYTEPPTESAGKQRLNPQATPDPWGRGTRPPAGKPTTTSSRALPPGASPRGSLTQAKPTSSGSGGALARVGRAVAGTPAGRVVGRGLGIIGLGLQAKDVVDRLRMRDPDTKNYMAGVANRASQRAEQQTRSRVNRGERSTGLQGPPIPDRLRNGMGPGGRAPSEPQEATRGGGSSSGAPERPSRRTERPPQAPGRPPRPSRGTNPPDAPPPPSEALLEATGGRPMDAPPPPTDQAPKPPDAAPTATAVDSDPELEYQRARSKWLDAPSTGSESRALLADMRKKREALAIWKEKNAT